jgi:hypothetical protein
MCADISILSIPTTDNALGTISPRECISSMHPTASMSIALFRYSFEIMSFSDIEAIVAATRIAATAASPTT